LIILESDPETIANRFLNTIVCAVPAALPAALSSGSAFAISRLKVKKIFCIQPNKMNDAGKI
jgi:cation-transporting P-type ATPase 13A2